MEIINEVEHEDGSATYTFDMTEEERSMVMEQGLIWMLVAGITGITPTKVMEDYIAQQETK